MEKENPHQKLVVLVPAGIPAMGKTSLFRGLQLRIEETEDTCNWEFFTVDSDTIARERINPNDD